MNTPRSLIPPAVQATLSSPEELEAQIESAVSKLTQASMQEPAPITAAPSTEEILKQRNKVHGDFQQDAYNAQMLKGIIHTSHNWEKMSVIQREALELICTKIGRICVGNPNHKDHWDDIAGYATLVSKRL